MPVKAAKKKSKKPDAYHHGDLRRALIRAGIKMLKSEGVMGLSMRKLAREAGVSHNAPYMHFADKHTVIAALAEEGFRQLRATILRSHAKHPDDWRNQLLVGSVAYVKYAKRNKALMDIMFLEYPEKQFPDLCEASEAALFTLIEVVERGQQAGGIADGDPIQYSFSIWAMLHGIAMILAGRKGPFEEMGESLEEIVGIRLEQLLDGLGVR